MRPISKETHTSVMAFLDNLNADQIKAISERMEEKQPYVKSYIASSLEGMISKKESTMLNFLFVFIIRCYEYEYGEMVLISDQTVGDYNTEQDLYTQRESKRNSLRKIVSSLSKDANQRELIDYIDKFLEDGNGFESGFNPAYLIIIKLVIYCTIILLNREAEKKNEAS